MPEFAKVFAFVDGAYLREVAQKGRVPYADPREMALTVIRGHDFFPASLMRTIYYDGWDDNASTTLKDYWSAVDDLPDTDIGWGSIRGKRRQQKGVDTLIAIDMLTNAFQKNYENAVLIAGDADFVPVVHEVRRFGVRVFLAAEASSVSSDLRNAADRFSLLTPAVGNSTFPFLMRAGGGYFQPTP